MSTRLNFTKTALADLPLPEAGQRTTYHDEGGRESVRGLHLRVTSGGTKTFGVLMRAAGGKPERLTLGRYPNMSIDRARALAKAKIAQLAEGVSPSAAKRESKARGMTVAEAFTVYVERKTRADDLPLKQRTRDDYMAMVKQPRLTAAGKRTQGGLLASLADKPIHALTADEIRACHTGNLETRGERQSNFAAMALKAVLRYHGVAIPHSPFDRATPEVDRIRIKKAGVSPREPIKQLSANLGAFWRALPDTPAGDYLRFLLLSGCRPSEPLKVKVGDLVYGSITLTDTKNRSNHILHLSRQALEIVQRQAEGKAPGDKLFDVKPAQANALAHELGSQLGFPFVPKVCRAAFASIAEKHVTFGVLKGLMNHKEKNDLLGTNYVTKTEEELRAGWQAVADHITTSS